MVKARKYVVKNHFNGVPKRDDFEIEEHELPELKDGEVLVKTEFISYHSLFSGYDYYRPYPYDKLGFQIAVVQESKDEKYPVGTKVVSFKGWCDYSILNTKATPKESKDEVYKLPDLTGFPDSMSIGAVGATAYFGFPEICKPKAGETVVVTETAGAVVGSIVGHMAKTKGCKVIGFADSDDKVTWLEKELSFDRAFNYKTVDVVKSLKEAAPDGVQCYFDNAGGEISSHIISQMKENGKVSVFGSISACNEELSALPKTTILQPSFVFNKIKIKVFLVLRYGNSAANNFLFKMHDKNLIVQEHVTEGFDKLYDAFDDIEVLALKNVCERVVKV